MKSPMFERSVVRCKSMVRGVPGESEGSESAIRERLTVSEKGSLPAVPLDDFVCHGNRITGFEHGILFFNGKSFFSNFN